MQKVYRLKRKLPGGDIIEISIRELDPERSHPEGVRYSSVYIHNKKRVIGYDNYEGKGHHKHIQEIEYPYNYTDRITLFNDFLYDVWKYRGA